MVTENNIAKLSMEASKLLNSISLSKNEFESISKDELIEKIAHSNFNATSKAEYQDIFQLIFYKGILLMTIADVETGKIIEVNEEFTNATGFEREEAIGKKHVELGLIDKNKEKFLRNKILKNGYIRDLILEVTKKDKDKIFINFNGQFINFNNQKRFLSVAKDITEYKKAEEELRKERRLLNTLIENIPIAIYIKDKKGNKVFVNKSDIKNIGKSKDEILGKNDFELFDVEIASKFYEDDKLVLEKGETILNKTEQVLDQDGNEKWLLTSKVPLYDINNNIEGLVGIGVDVSEKKKADDELKKYKEHLEAVVEERTIELKQANEKLEKEVELTTKAKSEVLNSLEKEVELNKIRSRFISTTSHEFKTPLTTILSSTELIEIFLKKKDDSKVYKHLERIKSTVDYLDNLINDVLLLNKTETGKIQFVPKETNLYEIISEIVDLFKKSLESGHQISLNYNIDKEKLYVIDSKLIEFAINNLLSNAIKYSPDESKIYIDVIETDSRIIFEVTDNGLGIDESEHGLIFNQFYRGSNTDYISGTGLGLSIVKKAIELHKGTVKVSSKINNGAKFIISIPSEVKIG